MAGWELTPQSCPLASTHIPIANPPPPTVITNKIELFLERKMSLLVLPINVYRLSHLLENVKKIMQQNP